jgi:hypothetical protein
MKSDVISADSTFREISSSFETIESNLYNNEIIGVLSIYSVMGKFSNISPSKALLILPLATHNALVSYLYDSRTIVKGLEQLIVKKPEFFSNFNQRFYSLLELSINSILILIKLDLVSIDQHGQLILNSYAQPLFENSKRSLLGIRAQKIIQASSSIADLLIEEVPNLYLQLRVEL